MHNIGDDDNKFTRSKNEQEAHGPWVAHLSDIATADVMQHFSNPVIATNEKIILILKKNIIHGMTVNGA